MAGNKDEETQAIVREIPRGKFRDLVNWEDAAKLWQDKLHKSSELGDGFAVLRNKDKDRLIGVPFLVVDFKFSPGDFGEFATMRVMTKDNQKFIVNDGSTGILEDLRLFFEETGQLGGLFVERGLRKSEYDWTDQKTGEVKPAVTYYLDTSPSA